MELPSRASPRIGILRLQCAPGAALQEIVSYKLEWGEITYFPQSLLGV